MCNQRTHGKGLSDENHSSQDSQERKEKEGGGRGFLEWSQKASTLSLIQCTSSPATVRIIYINFDLIDGQIYIPISLSNGLKKVKIQAMLDSGASSLFISPRIIQRYQLMTQKLTCPIHIHNIDQTPNVMGFITESVIVLLWLTIQKHSTNETFLIAKLGNNNAMIGIDWIKRHNPKVNWKTGTLDFTRCLPWC